jgi:hypothetical protein
MATSIIDGTIEEAVLKNRKRLGSRFDKVVFRLDDGGTKTWTRAVVMNNVAELLRPGTRGRFYLFTAIDHRGIHGVRTAGGREEFGVTRVNELAGLWISILNALVLVLYVAVLDRYSWTFWLALVLMVLGVPMYLAYRHTRLEAERHFAADAGYRPAAMQTRLVS